MPKTTECPDCGNSTLHVEKTLDGKVEHCTNCGYSSRPDSKSGQGFYESMGVKREEDSDSEDVNGQDES